jgi:hypothetical protein
VNYHYLLSLNQVSAKLDIPARRLYALVKQGEVKPDSVTDTAFYFDSSRLPELRNFVERLRSGQSPTLTVE